MEYHCGSKDATVASGSKEVTVASRIFEKAMELYSDEVEFVLRYLSFLISINDENSAFFSVRCNILLIHRISGYRRKSSVRACDRDILP